MRHYEFAVFESPEDQEPVKGTRFIDPDPEATREIVRRLDLLHEAGYTGASIRHRAVDITHGEWRG